MSWVSRVPETSLLAQAGVRQQPEHWQSMRSGTVSWWSQVHDLPHGRERWLVVRTTEGEERTWATMQRQASREQVAWEKRWHRLSQHVFACEADAEGAMHRLAEQHPAWLVPHVQVQVITKHAHRGRPAKEASPQTVGWHVQAQVTLDHEALRQEARRRAAFIIGTNLLDAQQWPDAAIITLYQEQVVVERGFAFRNRPVVSGVVRLREEATTHHGTRIDHGALSVSLQAGRSARAPAVSRHWSDGARSVASPHGSAHLALAVPVLSRAWICCRYVCSMALARPKSCVWPTCIDGSYSGFGQHMNVRI